MRKLYSFLQYKNQKAPLMQQYEHVLNQEEVCFHILHSNSCGMLLEAIEETGSGFRKITDKFRNKSFHK